MVETNESIDKRIEKQKQEWISSIQQKLKEFYKDVELVFCSTDFENGNLWLTNIPCTVVFKTETCFFIFELLNKKSVRYRFSTKDNSFWEVDLRDKDVIIKKHRVNLIKIFKEAKARLDNENKQNNLFFIMAENIEFEGNCNGLYIVTPSLFGNLLAKIARKS